MSGGKEEDIKKALLETKNANKDYQGMILIWDNAQTHKALETWGWENQIYFILLPPYSPDLNRSGEPSYRKNMEIAKKMGE